jgi:DNA-binding MarR family transcriptional regulator
MPKPLRIVSPVHKATRQIGEYMLEASRALGVEPNEGHLLSYTTLYGPCTVSELGRVFGYRPSTLTGILDRLEEAGLLVREPNAEDRRSFLIRVTPPGADVATALRERLEKMEREVEVRVTPRDMAGFEAVLTAVGNITGIRLRAESGEES